MSRKQPFVLGVFGQPHAGKSYAIDRIAERYPGTVLVYNHGQPSDFKKYHKIELLPLEDGSPLGFSYRDRQYSFEKDFMRLFKGKKVKCSMGKSKEQWALCELVARSKKIVDVLFIIDDATTVLGHSLHESMKFLLAKAKHNRVDVIIAAHCANYFPIQAFTLITHVKLFKTLVKPRKAEQVPNFDLVLHAWEKVKRAPKYTSYTIDMYERRIIKHQP